MSTDSPAPCAACNGTGSVSDGGLRPESIDCGECGGDGVVKPGSLQSINARLDYLKKEWLDEYGYSIDAETIERARRIVPLLRPLGVPYCYPTEDGWIQVEFDNDNKDCLVIK